MKNTTQQIAKLGLVVISILALNFISSANPSQIQIDLNVREGQGQAEINLEQLIAVLKEFKASNSEDTLLTSLNDSMTLNDKTALLHKLNKTLKTIESEKEKILVEQKNQIEKLRTERRSLQASRLSSGAKADALAAKKLFENILAESNLEAKTETKLSQLAEKSTITIRFLEIKGETKIVSLNSLQGALWESSSGRDVAQFR